LGGKESFVSPHGQQEQGKEYEQSFYEQPSLQQSPEVEETGQYQQHHNQLLQQLRLGFSVIDNSLAIAHKNILLLDKNAKTHHKTVLEFLNKASPPPESLENYIPSSSLILNQLSKFLNSPKSVFTHNESEF
jgi:hypothetical protein